MQTALIIDDSEFIRGMVGRLMTEVGFNCREAVNGVIALEELDIAPPCIIVCDFNMPEMDGAVWLAKPFKKEELLALVGTCLSIADGDSPVDSN